MLRRGGISHHRSRPPKPVRRLQQPHLEFFFFQPVGKKVPVVFPEDVYPVAESRWLSVDPQAPGGTYQCSFLTFRRGRADCDVFCGSAESQEKGGDGAIQDLPCDDKLVAGDGV